MADKKISQLTGVTTPLAGTEEIPVVQSSSTKKVTVDNLTAGRAVTAAQLDVDNIRLDANTVSTTNTNGNLVLAPNGTGVVKTPYITLDGVGAPQIYMQNSGTYSLQLLVSGAIATIGSTNNTPVKLITGGTAKITINSADSDVKLESGNLIIGTSGKGIDFSATSGTGTSELLADYEEGDWTPVVTSSIGSITSYTAAGKYTKIGRQVTLTWYIAAINNGTGAGAILVAGAPFSAAVGNTALFGYSQSNGNALTGSINGTSLVVYNYAALYPVATGQTINCSITYIV
jgi:hypothetical protein